MYVECHKNVFPEGPAPLKKMFIPIVNHAVQRTRRCMGNNVVVPRVKTNQGRKAFSYVGPVTWNGLEGNLKLVDKMEPFKRELKKLFSMFDDHPT